MIIFNFFSTSLSWSHDLIQEFCASYDLFKSHNVIVIIFNLFFMSLSRSYNLSHRFCKSFFNISFFFKLFCLYFIFEDIFYSSIFFYTQMKSIFHNKNYLFLNNILDMFSSA